MSIDLRRLSTYYSLVSDYMVERLHYSDPRLPRRLREAFFETVKSECSAPCCAVRLAEEILAEHTGLREILEEGIGRWGAVFVRSDSASPKDVCGWLELSYECFMKAGVFPVPGTACNACLCTRPEACVALLIVSERVQVLGGTDHVWIVAPAMFSSETRIFVKRCKPLLATHYYYLEPISEERLETYRVVLRRYIEELVEPICERLSKHGVDTFVVDAGMHHGKPRLVELTPFPPMGNERRLVGGVDTILFRDDFWDALEKAEKSNAMIARIAVSTHRVVEETIPLEGSDE